MTKVAVSHEPGDVEAMRYRAVAGRRQAAGRTAGEALDALAAQLPADETDSFVIVRDSRPDRFFGAERCRRLQDLSDLRQAVLAGKAQWTAEDEAELERLVDAELRAATERAEALARDLRR